MKLDMVFFDLDDTLYPQGNGVWREISNRITQYMIEKVGLAAEEAESHRQRYQRQFGTSLTGLMVEHEIEARDYLSYVHDIPLRQYLSPDPALADLIGSLPQRKAIFTNASRAHALRVLELLAISDHFEQIIAIEDTELINKPELRAYSTALKLTNQRTGERSLFVDDRVENLKPAAELGMKTVLVGTRQFSSDFIDFHIPSVYELVRAIPTLLDKQSNSRESN